MWQVPGVPHHVSTRWALIVSSFQCLQSKVVPMEHTVDNCVFPWCLGVIFADWDLVM